MIWVWVSVACGLGMAVLFAWAIFNSPDRDADEELEARELAAMRAVKDGKLSRLRRAK